MDSNEFYSWIKDTLNRGNTLDSSIPKYVQAAVSYIERQAPFADLEWWAEFKLEKEKDQVINLPSRLRDIVFLRIDTSDDTSTEENWEYVTRAAPKQTINREGKPKQFWTNQRQCLVLDALPDKDYPAELKIHRFTDFPDINAPDGTGHWLLDKAPGLLHAQVMTMMSGFIREDDPAMIKHFRTMAAEELRALIVEDAYSQEAAKGNEMVYWPQHIPYSYAFEDKSE